MRLGRIAEQQGRLRFLCVELFVLGLESSLLSYTIFSIHKHGPAM